jgi:hypothetical protein
MQHLLDIGVVRRQTWSPQMYALALEQGEDPNDPSSILFGGTPSGLTATVPVEAPSGSHDVPVQLATRPENVKKRNKKDRR